MRIGSAATIATMPSLASSAASALSPAFEVVSNLSPVKILLAPARKHSACVASLMLSRPADSRTMLRGIVIRATATVRTNSISSIIRSPPHRSPSNVPLTGTKALTGTLSGWRGSVASAWTKPMRSSRVSPIPTIPPQHTAIPAPRTSASVSSRSWKVRVVMMSP